MYRVLIVDDEPMVIHGLCRQIDWESYNLELEGTANTAENALSIIGQKKVDLLFTDICMPGVNGLSLISSARQTNPLLRSIIISAHSEFDYVKEALLLGVENYLLKPIDQKELDKTLEKTIENLKKSHESQQGNESGPLAFRDNILDRWLNGAIQDYEFYERAELLNINLSAHLYQICMVKILGQNTETFSQTLLEICRNILIPSFACELLADRLNRVVAVLSGDRLEEKQKELEACISRIVLAAAHSSIKVFACVGHISNSIENVPHDYLDSDSYLNYRYIDPNVDYIFYGNFLKVLDTCGCGPLLIQLEKALINDDTSNAVAVAQKVMESYCHFPADMAKTSTIPFLILLLKLMNESGRVSEILSGMETTLFSALKTLDFNEIPRNWFVELVTYSLEVMHKRKKSLHPLIFRALDMANKKYQLDLSLKTIATEFNISPAYLGQLFKVETGKYFNDYLTEARLLASKALLLETDLKIKGIVCRIGMSNQSYFNRIFKKTYGMSPLSFRYQGKQLI